MAGVRLSLLRHGECQGGARFNGRNDVALTGAGWQQMQDTAMGGAPWDAVVSSPLQRCRLFAEQWADQYTCPLWIDADWREFDFGDWEGYSAAELMQDPTQAAALTRFWQNPIAHPPPGGETPDALERRVLAGTARVQARHAGQRVLVVTHAGVIRTLLGLQQGLTWPERLGLAVPHAALFDTCFPFPACTPFSSP